MPAERLTDEPDEEYYFEIEECEWCGEPLNGDYDGICTRCYFDDDLGDYFDTDLED